MKNRIKIIAEIGVNHNGDISLAKKLIDEAKKAGADYVKFQTFKADKLVTKKTKKTVYQIKNTNDSESHKDMLARLELSRDMHKKIIAHCKKQKIKFLSSAFDIESVDLLSKLGQKIFKIPSGEITNQPLLEAIGKCRLDVVVDEKLIFEAFDFYDK